MENIENQEIWKDIPNFEGYYQISNLGRVKSLDRWIVAKLGKYLKIGKICNFRYDYGYKKVKLSKNNKVKILSIHRLLAILFIPNPNNYPIINHKDGNKLNNNINNLEWCNRQHNVQHAWDNGLMSSEKISGENNYLAKFTNEEVLKIREMFSTGKYLKADLARQFNCDFTTIGKLIRKQTYKYV